MKNNYKNVVITIILVVCTIITSKAQIGSLYLDSVAAWSNNPFCKTTTDSVAVHGLSGVTFVKWGYGGVYYYTPILYVPNTFNGTISFFHTGGTKSVYINFEEGLVSPGLLNQTVCGSSPIQLDAGNPGSQYDWSTGDTNQTISVNTTGIYWVDISNSCGVIGDSAIMTFVAPVAHLCMVTFDTATQKNSIIWNGINEQVDKAIILKRNLSNAMVPVDTVYFTDGAWIDYQSTPLTDQYEYSMLLLDTCNNISDTATHHKTIWLQISSYSTDVYFHYTPYMGITVPTYTLRGIKANGTIDSLKSVAAAFTDFSLPASIAQNYQRFYIDFTTSCGSSKSVIKVQSNTVSGPTGINDDLVKNKLSIFPNPAQDRIFIQTPETSFETEIINVFGQVLKQDRNKTEIDISTLPTGTYILRLTGKVYSGQKSFIVY